MSEGTKTDITKIDANAKGLCDGVDGGFLSNSLVVCWSTNHSKSGVGDSITPSL
jgi:hypothetical protein